MQKLDRTPLNVNQLQNMEDTSNEWFNDELATTIGYKRFNVATTPNDIYDESPDKIFDEAEDLRAIVTLDPTPEYLDEMGLEERVDAIFIIMQKELTDKDIEITKADIIVYKSVEYNVTNAREYGQTIKGRNLLMQIIGMKSPLKV